MNEDGTATLVGIVSFGFHCADPNYPGVYTKIAPFYHWVLSRMKHDSNNTDSTTVTTTVTTDTHSSEIITTDRILVITRLPEYEWEFERQNGRVWSRRRKEIDSKNNFSVRPPYRTQLQNIIWCRLWNRYCGTVWKT